MSQATAVEPLNTFVVDFIRENPNTSSLRIYNAVRHFRNDNGVHGIYKFSKILAVLAEERDNNRIKQDPQNLGWSLV